MRSSMMIAFPAWAMSQNKRSANDRARAKNFLGLLLKLASTLGGGAVVKLAKAEVKLGTMWFCAQHYCLMALLYGPLRLAFAIL